MFGARLRALCLGALFAVCVLATSGCGPAPVAETEVVPVGRPEPAGRILRIGDIDPDTPARRKARLQPLAVHLAGRLTDLGFGSGDVVIARDLDEMSRLILQGSVDLYVDSAFPSLVVQERAGSKILLRRHVNGSASYRTMFVTAATSDIDSLDRLEGLSLALQEEYSTSGFLLPAGTLLARGYELHRVDGPMERSGLEGVDYFFTRDEENTVELVQTGRAPVGAISSQDYEQLPAALRDRLRVIGESPSVPRQLVSVSPDLESLVAERIVAELLALAAPDEDPVTLEDSELAWTWKFEPLSDEDSSQLVRLRELARLAGVL